jgi:Colicin V production protein.
MIFPRVKPYFIGIIHNEYVLDVGLGVTNFMLVIFFMLMVLKGISTAVKYAGVGNFDTVFGFFFGFVRAYLISICIFSAIHIVYSYDKWPVNVDESYILPSLANGSNYF